MIPHLLVPRPWAEERIGLSSDQGHHLERVLRIRSGGPVTYTDGTGTTGRGTVDDAVIIRGPETTVPALAPLVVAVAPPASRERLRFVVEKLAELEVTRVAWLATRRGEGRPPPAEKAAAWAAAALEQSRGAHLTVVDAALSTLDSLPGPVVVAIPGGGIVPAGGPLTVAIGPEGGWEPGEVPAGMPAAGLGRTILRVETAAVAAAVLVRRGVATVT